MYFLAAKLGKVFIFTGGEQTDQCWQNLSAWEGGESRVKVA